MQKLSVFIIKITKNLLPGKTFYVIANCIKKWNPSLTDSTFFTNFL